ncbi:hypothetical protein ACREYJ_14860 [Pseudomonas kribbensis]|uniref:hypothetical protein n=1 Tax=Pseudomonas kribbensis TaxID=1628086 RepID=UPI003D78A049
MQPIAKIVCLAALIPLSCTSVTPAAEEPSIHELAVVGIAVGRACAELHPFKDYTLQNMLDDPTLVSNKELRAEILKVDKGPEFQLAISDAQAIFIGEEQYMNTMCSNYAPMARK